jgi:Asp-tRNA(Asn)/Glu-tRNA(Gln) amidotransferase B subunit
MIPITPADVIALISVLGSLEIEARRQHQTLSAIEQSRIADGRGYYTEAEMREISTARETARDYAYAQLADARAREAAQRVAAAVPAPASDPAHGLAGGVGS